MQQFFLKQFVSNKNEKKAQTSMKENVYLGFSIL